MIDRWITKRISAHFEHMPAIALLGPRQVGKTTVAKQFASHQSALYLDLESAADQFKLSAPADFLRQHTDKLIILDEIQRMPNLFTVLRGLIDERRSQGRKTTQFLLLGSASMDLLRQSSESLAGRISYIEMSGFNPLEMNHDANALYQLWLRGGFPVHSRRRGVC